MIQLQINTNDFDRTAEEIARRVTALNYTPVMRQITRDLEKLHGLYFDAEAGPAGVWKPLAPHTIQQKGHAVRLWETGRLESSLRSRTSDSIRSLSRSGNKTRLEFGTSRPFAGIHQRGSARIPRRVHVGVTRAVAKVIVKRVTASTLNQLNRSTRSKAA